MSAAHKLPKSNSQLRKGQALVASGRLSEALTAFEAALEADPTSTPALSGLGMAAQRLGMVDAAREFFARALLLDPDAMEARAGLASAYRASGEHDKAIAVIKEGIERDPDAAALWLSLGNTVREQGDLDNAETFYREATALKPNYGAALGNLADLLFDRGDTDAAMSYYDRAVQTAPKNAQLRMNRAVAALALGQAAKGWREYEWRFRALEKPLRYGHGLRPYDGRELSGKRLLLAAEQGIGDQILFACLIPTLLRQAKGEIIIECEKRLVPLFARSFPEAAVHEQTLIEQDGTRHVRYHWLKDAGGADYALPLGSLPKLLKVSAEWTQDPAAPLVPDTDEKAKWQDWLTSLGEGPYTGLCWRSGKTSGVRAIQYAPLEAWAAFAKGLPGELVCAQYDATEDEVAKLSELTGCTVHVPPGLDQREEIDRSCALLAALTRVISAPTAIAAQAASVGTPTVKVLFTKGWTNMGAAHEPLQPACKIAAGNGTGNWADVFEKARALIA